jgi:hypothetical protein
MFTLQVGPRKFDMYLCNQCPFLEKDNGHSILKELLKHFKGPLCALRESLNENIDRFCSTYENLNREKETIINFHPCEKIRTGIRGLFSGLMGEISSKFKSGEFPYGWREEITTALLETECQIEKILESKDIFIVNCPENKDYALLEAQFETAKEVNCNGQR